VRIEREKGKDSDTCLTCHILNTVSDPIPPRSKQGTTVLSWSQGSVCGVVCVPPHSGLSSCAALPRHVIQDVRHQRYTEFTIGQKNRTCVITLTISYSRPFDSIGFVCSKQQLSTHTHTQHKITQYSIPVRCPLHAIHLSQSTRSSLNMLQRS
jgi:hypothetical protein